MENSEKCFKIIMLCVWYFCDPTETEVDADKKYYWSQIQWNDWSLNNLFNVVEKYFRAVKLLSTKYSCMHHHICLM